MRGSGAETHCRLVQKEVPEGLNALGSFRLDADVSHLRLEKGQPMALIHFLLLSPVFDKHSSPHQKCYLCLGHVQKRMPTEAPVIAIMVETR